MEPSNRKRTTSPGSKYFPAELWTDILARLPVKSLLRFRCVSKTLKNFIDDPKFIPLHRRLSNNNNRKSHLCVLEAKVYTASLTLIIRPSDIFNDTTKPDQVTTIKLPDHSGPNRYSCMAMFNGLVLIQMLVRKVDEFQSRMRRGRTTFYKILDDRLILWNPSVRKSLLLPIPANPFPHNENRDYYYPYDKVCHDDDDDDDDDDHEELVRRRLPKASYFNYALGFAPSANDYKVLAVRYDQYSLLLSTSVYGLANGFWKTKCRTIDFPSWWWKLPYRTRSLGGANWLVGDPNVNGGKKTHVVCFDFDEEEFKFVKLPDELLGGENEMLLFLFYLGESLAVLGVSVVTTCIWVMEEDKNGKKGPWTKRYSGDSGLSCYESFKEWNKAMAILYLENNGVFLVKTQGSLTSYNLKNHEMCHHNMHKGYADCYLTTYVESMVLTKALEGQTLSFFPAKMEFSSDSEFEISDDDSN